MDVLNEISNEEFVQLLHSLGVETFNLNFEWMLNNPDFSGVLRWLYNNLDQNNALTAQEECRYSKVAKEGGTLSHEDLEAAVASLQEEFEGICLPGDQEAFEDAQSDVKMMEERLTFLDNQESVLNNILQQNELSKQKLTREVIKLHSAERQYLSDEEKISEECVALAEEVEKSMDGVIDVVVDELESYRNTGVKQMKKETAKKFFTFGPLNLYRETQDLFRSHFDQYADMKFNKKNHSITDEDIKSALIEAKNMESRLSEAASAYIESKAELAGQEAELAICANFTNVHPSLIKIQLAEAQSAVELLKHEESIIKQEIDGAVRQFVDERTKLVEETTASAALAVREEIHSSLQFLLETTHSALSLDKLVYFVLRHELRTVEEFVQFATQIREYVVQEERAQCIRFNSMNEIIREQEICLQKQKTSSLLLNTLFTISDVPTSNDILLLVKLYNDLQASLKENQEAVVQGLKRKEDAINAYKNSTNSLKAYVYDGCTKLPNCSDPGIAGLMHELKYCIAELEERVAETGSLFNALQIGDENNLRKFWQWFLTHQGKLLALLNVNQPLKTK